MLDLTGDPYRNLAAVYDTLGFSQLGELCATEIKSELEKRISPGALLDLGCGTARGGIVFASAGWKVKGIDISTSMLALARLQALEAKVEIEFSRQDIRVLNVLKKFDLITCFLTLNHLLKVEEIEKTIKQVGQALRKGGFFAADFFSAETLHSPLMSKAITSRDIYLLRFDDLTNLPIRTIRLVWFKRRGDLYEKWESQLEERAYSWTEMSKILEKNGFIVRSTWDLSSGKPTPGEGPHRLFLAESTA